MQRSVILAIESMTSGNLEMAKRAEELGYHLRILAEDSSIYSDVNGLEIVEFDTRDFDALRRYVSGFHGEIATIFSPTDTWGVDAAKLRDEFGYSSRYSANELARFRDKQWVRAKLSQDVGNDDCYPRILKPRRGTGSSEIMLIESKEQLDKALASRNLENFVDEPFHRGPLYSAELYSDGTKLAFFGVTNRILTPPPVFLEKVKTFPHAHGTAWERSVQRWAGDLLRSLEYNAGFAHLEFVETDHGFEIIELNARMAGALITPAVDACTNFAPYTMVIDDALGIDVELPAHREISQGFSHVSLYANQVGILDDISGTDTLNYYPGNPTWIPSKPLNARITELGTYRSRIGNVYATAATPDIAQDRAIAASQTVEVTIT